MFNYLLFCNPISEYTITLMFLIRVQGGAHNTFIAISFDLFRGLYVLKYSLLIFRHFLFHCVDENLIIIIILIAIFWRQLALSAPSNFCPPSKETKNIKPNVNKVLDKIESLRNFSFGWHLTFNLLYISTL